MDSFDFVETDAAEIYTALMGSLMDACGEALYPGDERRIFGEALAAVFTALYSEFNDKMKQRTLRYARGRVLDAIGERYGVLRAPATGARAVFRFSVQAPLAQNIVIPQGTRITTDGSVYFALSGTAVLQAGETYVDGAGDCLTGGSAFNGFPPGAVATLVDVIPYLSGAENLTATEGGDDGEPYGDEGDARLRERIRLAPSRQSTAGPESAYRYFALSADPDIADVAVESPEASVVRIYPLMKGGGLPNEETRGKISAALSGDVRPLTDRVEVLQPEVVEFTLEVKYYCAREDEAAVVKTIEGPGGAVERYLAWQSQALARDVNPDRLRRFLLAPDWAEGLTGAVRVEVTAPDYKALGKHQVARLSGAPAIFHGLTN